MKNILCILVLLSSCVSFAQTDKPYVIDSAYTDVFTIVEVMPSFKGGDKKMIKFIQKNIQYPETERTARISGTCYINFIVEKDGSLSHIKVLRGVSGGPGLEKEAVRVISIMPKWIPGKQNGKNVRTMYNLPIKYSL